MAERQLTIISGSLSRTARPRTAVAQEAIARRWRLFSQPDARSEASTDVIPLLDGWIRRLEREAGSDPREPH